MSKPKVKQFHVGSSKLGVGQSYGTGIKNKVGRSIDNSIFPKVGNKKIGKPPKSLA